MSMDVGGGSPGCEPENARAGMTPVRGGQRESANLPAPESPTRHDEMSTSIRALERQTRRYHPNSYQFIYQALRFTQQSLNRKGQSPGKDAHISGAELLEGIRVLALRQFGLMSRTVFRVWGIRRTSDFGRIVFELIERGEMSKTEHDQLSDFLDVYDFAVAFDRDYRVDLGKAFSK
jgi:uncharacterized repeat protein (TIGR04138 family)